MDVQPFFCEPFGGEPFTSHPVGIHIVQVKFGLFTQKNLTE